MTDPKKREKELERQRRSKRAIDPVKKRLAQQKFRQQHPNYLRDWKRKAFKESAQYVMVNRLRSRVSQMLSGKKDRKTLEMLGCSVAQFIAYIEAKFLPGMTWENRNEWHLDHIRPCKSFDLTNPLDRDICFHYTNYQPLWAIDNLRKHARLDYVYPTHNS